MILLKDVSLERSAWLCIALGMDHSFFDGGGGGEGWKIVTCKYYFLYAGPAANNFFGVFPSSCKHFFLAYNLFQRLQPLQTI